MLYNSIYSRFLDGVFIETESKIEVIRECGIDI